MNDRIRPRRGPAVRDGANLAPDRAVGRRTWEDFLAAEVSSPSDTTSVPT
jgi:hypothetical protein